MFKISFIIFISIIYFAVYSYAQSNTGSIAGVVKDSLGANVPMATVYLENTSYAGTADANGRFNLSNISPGTYTLVVSLLGFHTEKRTIKVGPQKNQHIEIMLKESAHTLDEVTVIGQTKTEIQKIEEQPIVIDVIELLENQKKSSSLAQLLNLSTGIRVRQSSGVGSDININLNGMQGKSIRMFRDGIPLDYLGKAFDISLVPTATLQRVEVYKGVLPAQLGADALGGAINLITKNFSENSLNVSYAYGSFNTHEATLSGYKLLNRKAFVSTQSYYVSSDNNYWIDAKVIDDETKNYKDVRVRRFHDGVASLYLSSKVGLLKNKILDKTEFEVGFFNHTSQLQHDLYMTRPYGQAELSQKLIQANALIEKSFHDIFKADFFIAYSKTFDSFTDTTRFRYNWLGKPATVSTNEGEVNNIPALQQIEYNQWLGRLMLVLFGNRNHSITYSHNFKYVSRLGENPPGQKVINTDIDPLTIKSAYFRNVFSIGLKSDLFNGRLTNLFTIKNYNIKTSGVDIQYSYTAEAETSNESLFGISNSIKYNFSPFTFARVSYERSARIPDAEEYFGNGLTVSCNLNLLSERSSNLNLGMSSYFYYPARNKFDLNLFLRDQQNLIVLIPWLPFGRYENWSEARSMGVELSNSGRITKNLHYLVNLTYQDIRRTGISNPAEQSLLHSRIPNIPFFFTNFSLNYLIDSIFNTNSKVNIYSTYGMTGHYYLQAIPKSMQSTSVFGKAKVESELIIPTQHVLDLGLTYSASKLPIDINFEVNNLLDNKLYDRFRVQKPGRNYRIKLSFHLNNKK